MSEINKRDLIALVNALDKINNKMAETTNLTSEDYIWCQTQAMDLGEYIEGTYYEVVDVSFLIKALEDYCEQIYQLSITEDAETRKHIAHIITKDLETVKKELTDKFPEKDF